MNRIENVGLEVFENVPSNDCDLTGRFTPANVFKKLTELAGINAIQLGFGFDDMLAHDLYWVLSRMKVKFLRRPNAGELLQWRTWPKTIQQKLFYVRDFKILDENQQTVMLASSAWLVIHATKRRLLPPNRLPGLDLPSLEHLVALDESLEKLQIDDTSEAFTMTARYSYIDMLGHMNNARYVEAITNAVPFDLMTKRELDWIQVNYDKEVRPQERLSIRVAELSEDLYGVEGFNLDSEQQAFTAQLKFLPE
ncbi:MAG TPA: thioesterase [Anaerolineaceae bacterium]|nr:thioesterase [Anaerolineaceae bacterium]HQL91980.1 thioesterase [Anaerolineaceae bacterium]